MGLKGICRFLSHRLFEAFVVVLLILFLPHLPPYTSISEPFSVSPAKPFEGKLSLNEKLNEVEIWHKGELNGPEAFADYNGELYVSVYEGDIVKLTNNHITPIVKTGKPCKGHHEERICGRPLGIEFDKNGVLYAADAYYGIFKVDVKTGEKTLVISVDQEIEGKKPKVPNNIALANNGDIFWSDSSTEFLLEDGIFDLLADPSGRLIHYDSKTKKNKVLIDKIHFANGVALSDNEEFVIVAETARNRIHRYYLKGPKAGTHDIFIDGLPGIPDNVKPDGRGGFFVPLLIAVDKDHPMPDQVIAPFPLLRKLVARLFGLTQMVFEALNRVYPCEFAQRAVHFIGHFSSASSLMVSARTTVLQVDKNGNIVDSLHGLNKKIGRICEVHVFKDTLYLGSPFNDYIGKIPLSKIGWEHLAPERKKRDVPVEERVIKADETKSTTQQSTASTPPTTSIPPTTPPSPRQMPPAQPAKQQAPTPSPKQRPLPSPPKQQTTPPPPPQQQTPPPPPKQQTPPPPKQQTPPPPPKQQTPPLPSKQQTSPPPPPKSSTPPKQQTPPPPPQQQTPPPPKQQTPPPPQQQTPPPPKQQTPPPSQQQSSPPPKRQTPPPPPKQQTPPVTEKPTSQPKQETPTPAPKQQDLPAQKQTPPSQSPPSKQSAPPVAQPIRDQTKDIPVKESTKAT